MFVIMEAIYGDLGHMATYYVKPYDLVFHLLRSQIYCTCGRSVSPVYKATPAKWQ